MGRGKAWVFLTIPGTPAAHKRFGHVFQEIPMSGRDFMPFSNTLNPFRALDRQIDRMFDDSFGAGAAGVAAKTAGVSEEEAGKSPSLFMRVVGITSRINKG
jgi:hypothetical protein